MHRMLCAAALSLAVLLAPQAAAQPAATPGVMSLRRELVRLGYPWGQSGHRQTFGNRDPVALDLFVRLKAPISPFWIGQMLRDTDPVEPAFAAVVKQAVGAGALACPAFPAVSTYAPGVMAGDFTAVIEGPRNFGGFDEFEYIFRDPLRAARAIDICGARHWRTTVTATIAHLEARSPPPAADAANCTEDVNSIDRSIWIAASTSTVGVGGARFPQPAPGSLSTPRQKAFLTHLRTLDTWKYQLMALSPEERFQNGLLLFCADGLRFTSDDEPMGARGLPPQRLQASVLRAMLARLR